MSHQPDIEGDMMAVMVEVRGLVKEFKGSNGSPFLAVKGINLDIRKGEIYSLLGPNGAGKTTTISMIGGLIAPTRGDATIGGYSITKHPLDAKKLLGVVPQEIALYPSLTARQNLEFFGKMYGMSGASLQKRVDEVVEFVDLSDRQHERVDKFSGGMKRRVNIGIGLLHKPQLIYMDEPTVGIDPQNRRRVLDTVLRMRDEFGMTVLYTSHLMEEVQEISDRVGIMDHGEIIGEGTVGELIQQIGEEDRLIFRVGAQTIPASVLDAMKALDGIGSVTYEQHHPIHNGGSAHEEADAEAIAASPRSTAERAALKAARSTGEQTAVAAETTDGMIVVRAKRGRRSLPLLIQIANDAGIDILSVEVREPDLEAVFLQLTGRALRD
ncbi:MAG: ABC transporter ATP-binding protein [Anaerolineae bacterium]